MVRFVLDMLNLEYRVIFEGKMFRRILGKYGFSV